MAILVVGKSICPLCGNVIMESDEIIMFPPFIQNTIDPFYVFNDVGVHKKCLDSHILGERALMYLYLTVYKTRPENRICDIAGNIITSPDNYLFIDLLSSDANSCLSKFNFMNIDKRNIPIWPSRELFLECARAIMVSGKWKSLTDWNYLDYLIKEVSERFEDTSKN